MVKAGEVGGALEEVLGRLVAFMETSENLRSIVGAMIYPALLSSFVGVVSITILTLFVVPRFASIFQDMGVPLPFAMAVLKNFSDFISGYWWLLALSILIISYYLKRLRSTAEGRLGTGSLAPPRSPRRPGITQSGGGAVCQNSGHPAARGVPLLQAMTIVREVISNQGIATAIEPIRNGIKKGEGIALPMKQSGVFPPLAMHLIEVGEESGKLDAMLVQVAEVYDVEVRNGVKNLIAFFEPALILVMGVIIGTVVVSMLLAIFSINDIPF